MNSPFDLAQWAQDTNPEETAEWREALLSLLANEGPERVNQILNSLTAVARQHRTGWLPDLNTPSPTPFLSTTNRSFLVIFKLKNV
jgi:pyruvate dehydrogenase E1 component